MHNKKRKNEKSLIIWNVDFVDTGMLQAMIAMHPASKIIIIIYNLNSSLKG